MGNIDKVNEDDLYYLKDTKEIYKGLTPFTSSIELYNGNDILLPEDANNIANNRIYFNTNTLEGKIYNSNDGEWVTIVKPLGEVVDTNNSNPVSGKAVKDYVDPKYNKLSYDINIERTRIDNIATISGGESATDEEVTEVLDEVFGTED